MAKKNSENNIFRQLADIRAVDKWGNLDLPEIPARRRSYWTRKRLTADAPRESDQSMEIVSRPREIIIEYQPTCVKAIEKLPSRDELLNQLEEIYWAEKKAPPAGSFAAAPSRVGVRCNSVETAEKKQQTGIFCSALLYGKNVFTNRRSFLIVGAFILVAGSIAAIAVWHPISSGFRAQNISTSQERLLKARDLLASLDFSTGDQALSGVREYQSTQVRTQIAAAAGVLKDILANVPPDDRDISGLAELINIFSRISTDLAMAEEGLVEQNPFALLGRDKSSHSLTEVLAAANPYYEEALAHLDNVDGIIKTISGNASAAGVSEAVLQLGDKAAGLKDIIRARFELNVFLMRFLGADKPKKLLLVIQNPTVPRGTGGFLTGYLLTDLDRGRVGDLLTELVSSADSRLREKMIPPRPLQDLDIVWNMTGSSWFLDYSLSAQKMSWFLEKASGLKVDYVALVSPRIFEDLLKTTGSIGVSESLKVISAENFPDFLDSSFKSDPSDSGQFLKTLGEFTFKFWASIRNLESQSARGALRSIGKNLEEKNIILYATDPQDQAFIEEREWAGRVKPAKGNYLAVVDSVLNEGGPEVGRLTKQLNEETEIAADGRVVTTLTITYQGPARRKAEDKSKPEKDKVLRDFVRIYVPYGADVLETKIPKQEVYFPPIDYYAAGFRSDPDLADSEYGLMTDISGMDIFPESGKTVFGFWLKIASGESKTVVLKYQLPFRITADNNTYSMLWQRQPADYSGFASIFKFPEAFRPVDGLPNDMRVLPDSLQMDGLLDGDRYYEVHFDL